MNTLLVNTLKQVNISLKVIDALCDARNENRIPIKYYFNRDVNMFIIEPIEEKDYKRFYWITSLMFDYPNLKERAEKNYKTIVTKNMKNLFYPWED